jgi:hypothetical protein
VGIVGMHPEGMPCEKISLDSTSSMLASISHSDSITVWDIDSAAEEKEEDDEDEDRDVSDVSDKSDSEEEEETIVVPEKKKRRKLKNKLIGSSDSLVNKDFFAEID